MTIANIFYLPNSVRREILLTLNCPKEQKKHRTCDIIKNNINIHV